MERILIIFINRYKCPGFRDDVEYKFCNKTFTFTEITREKWIE